jgi:hypothetical protein
MNFENPSVSEKMGKNKEAALERALKNSLLRDDEYTMQVIREGGYTIDGKFVPINDFNDFLTQREQILKSQGKYTQGGPKVKPEHLVQHSDPYEKIE